MADTGWLLPGSQTYVNNPSWYNWNTNGAGVTTDASGNVYAVQLSDSNWTHVSLAESISAGSATEIGTAKDPGVSLATSYTNYDEGGSSDQWGTTLTKSMVEASDFGVGVQFNNTSESHITDKFYAYDFGVSLPAGATVTGIEFRIRAGWVSGAYAAMVAVWLKVHYSTNSAPTISAGPTMSYGSYGKVSPDDDGTLTFTAQDTDTGDQGTDALSWNIRTATGGGGNLVTSGTCTHNVEESVTLTAAMLDAAGVPEDTATTLYLTVSDDEPESVETSFSVTAIYAHTYNSLNGSDTILLVSSGTETEEILETGGSDTLLVSDSGTLTFEWLDLSGSDTYLLISGGTDELVYIETSGGDILLVTETGTETLDILETGGLDLLLLLDSGTETVNLNETNGSDLLLVVDSGTDNIGFLETSGGDVILLVDGGTNTQLYGETNGLDTLFLVESGTETISFLETSGGDTLLLIDSGSDFLGFNELTGSDVLLLVESGTETLSFLETAGRDILIVVESGTESEDIVETSGQDLYLIIEGGFSGEGIIETSGRDVLLFSETGYEWFKTIVRDPLELTVLRVTTDDTATIVQVNPYRTLVGTQGPYDIQLSVK